VVVKQAAVKYFEPRKASGAYLDPFLIFKILSIEGDRDLQRDSLRTNPSENFKQKILSRSFLPPTCPAGAHPSKRPLSFVDRRFANGLWLDFASGWDIRMHLFRERNVDLADYLAHVFFDTGC